MTGGLAHTVSQGVHAVAGIDWRFALVALVLQLANMACHAFAFRNVAVAAYPGADLGVREAGAAYVAGSAFNTFLPARGGEAVKVGLLRLQVPHASTITLAGASSVVLLFDMVIGIAMFAAAWALGGVPAPPHGIGSGLVTAHPVASMVVVSVVAVVARRLARPLRGAGRKLVRGLAVLRTPRTYLRGVVVYQAAAWLLRVGVTLALLAAFGLPASLHAAMLIVVLSGISTMLTPGGAGAQQVLAVFALQGVATSSAALGYAVGAQVVISAINCTVGLVALMWLVGHVHPWRALRAAIGHARHAPAVHAQEKEVHPHVGAVGATAAGVAAPLPDAA